MVTAVRTYRGASVDDVFAKVAEELEELRVEIAGGADEGRVADELGDVLFTLVNVGRKAGVDPESALRRQLSRFSGRWRYIETQAAALGREVGALRLDEMESLWRDAKRSERIGT